MIALAPSFTACHSPTRPPQLSDSAVVLSLPIVEQDAMYECGLVSISALCAYWRHDLPEDERVALVRMAAERKGLSGAELREALERSGFEVFVFSGTLTEGPTALEHNVDAGRPLIVMTNEQGSNHYSLFIGYDRELKNVLLLDPRRGRIAVPTSVFERKWSSTERFTLLATPRA